LFECPSLTHEPLNQLPQIWVGELGTTREMFLSGKTFKIEWVDFSRENSRHSWS